MSKAVSKCLEFQAFIKFLARASSQLSRIYGPSCNNQPNTIALAAAKEWDGFSNCEKNLFLEGHLHDQELEADRRKQAKIGSFIRYAAINRELLNHEYPKLTSQDKTKILAKKWTFLTEDEKKRYSEVELNDWRAHNFMVNRARLKKIYTDSDELRLLELILNSRPRSAKSSFGWFLAENLLVANSNSSRLWNSLNDEEREQYEEKARIDKLRYRFELSLWKTKLLMNDYSRSDLKPCDFSFESVLSLQDIDNLVNEEMLKKVRRPTHFRGSPFTFFYRDFCSKNKGLKFGEAMKIASEAWKALPQESKDHYRKMHGEAKSDSTKAIITYIESNLQEMNPTNVEMIFRHNRRERGLTKPSQLVKRVIPAPLLYLHDKKNSSDSNRITWKQLDSSVQKIYIEKEKLLRERNAADRLELARRQRHVNELIKKANNLKKYKIKFNLMKK